ncbi:capsid protein [Feline astrovirus D1]|uniref:Capsid protein n=1 Tax=Feline astrovirus D1 TaxID=1538452 RepID=A0A076JVB5_9VIRU|nr:capsid protein [Feline astrovirus D1]AII82241.1 capsid protein [Feline astrovirus D1]
MAGNAQAAAKAKTTIKEVAKEIVKEAKNTNQRQNRPSKRWHKKGRHMPKNGNKNNNGKINQTVDRDVKRKLKKEGLEGPRSRFSVHVSATIGKIGPNKDQGPELQVATFLHPALMKEPNDGTNFGPLQAAAAQWGLWRLASLSVRFTPLVGSSAVTGSVFRASLNLTQSPGNASWGGLGARKHLDVPVGRSQSWRLQRGDLAGPRQTWWMTDTNEEGGQSCGPMLEIHGLGRSTSTYQDRAWAGDLFIVEVEGRWEFTNYNSKPALGTLDRKTEEMTGDKAPSMAVGDDGILTMTLQPGTRMVHFMGEQYERNAPPEGTIGETIWQVVDEGAGLASSIAPVPFGWLIKGAWWFVKKIAGRAGSNAPVRYQVFASLADAQNGKPVMAERMESQSANTTLTVTQMNAPNVGPGVGVPTYQTSYTPYPLTPAEHPPPPGSKVVLTARGTPVFFVQYRDMLDSVLKGHLRRSADDYPFLLKRGSRVSYASSAYLLSEPIALTYDGTSITGCYDPFWFKNTGISLHWRRTPDSIGQVIAYAADNWGTESAPFSCAVWLVRTTRDLPRHTVTEMWPYAPGAYVAGGSSITPPLQVTLNKANAVALSKPQSTSHQECQANMIDIPSSSLLLVYSVGVNKASSEAGLPLANHLPLWRMMLLSAVGRVPTGFWAQAMSLATPLSDYLSVRFVLPAASHDEQIESLLNGHHYRFNLLIMASSWQDKPDDGSDESDYSSDDQRELEYTSPKDRFAKERVYEALRDSDWDHVDAEALIQVMNGARRMLNTTRGHAE